MCIIAIKPAGIKMPSTETRENMWYGNSDGGGYMVATGNEVVIRKGFMKFSEFEDALKTEGDLTDRTVVMHYRITTHGGTSKQNCHPFPITSNVNIITKPALRTDIGVAHNGIISNVTPRKGVSDTMEYILSQLSHMKKIDKFFYKKPEWLALIEDAIDSKMVFLDKYGKFTTIGDFTEDNGVLYSNSSYKASRYKGHYSTLGSSYGYGYWDIDEYEGEYFDWKKLMDLDDSAPSGFAGEDYCIVNIETGKYFQPALTDSYAVDSVGNLYKYDCEWDCYIAEDDHIAFTRNFEPIIFEEDLATMVAIMK